MTVTPLRRTDRQPVADPAAEVVERAKRSAAALDRAGRDADAAPAFPRDGVEALHEAGLLTAFAPRESGGAALTKAQRAHALMNTLRIVGRADLSLGRIFEGHVNALALFDWYGSAAQKAELATRLAEGRVYGVWATEPAPGVRITADNALEGVKSFATGAGEIDYAIVTAARAETRRLIIAPANDAARADVSGWTVRGMRATMSGRYDLSGLPVAPDMLLGGPGDYDLEPRFTGGAWRFAAVQLGGVERILMLMREALSEAAREDPLIRRQFGAAVVAARSAYLWVREAGLRSESETPDAGSFALMTRGVVERAGLDVIELASRAVGTRAFFTGGDLDRFCRDLGLYLRQAGPDHARDRAAAAWLERDCWGAGDELW
ncbi:MAG TPA: acyl-CoA dehydrogenase family protein [Hansschlegelia sp.]